MGYVLEKNTSKLELNTILALLADKACLEASKEAALRILPENDINKVKELLCETEAAYGIIAKFSTPSFGNAHDISDSLSRADLGSALSAAELIDVAEVLRVIRTVKIWRDSFSNTAQTAIDPLFESLSPNKYLEDKINFVIKSPEEINDNATPLLADIRRKITAHSSKIRANLDRIIHGTLSKYLRDPVITQRDGRFVVPVRAEFKGEIKGIVHDTSSTGQTYFVEPISVVESNNEIRILRIKETEEINRILAELSADVSAFSDSIRFSYASLSKLDLIFAKAKLAFDMSASMPKINSEGIISLKGARHPLIEKNKVVPIDISVGSGYNTLVITGPNTGGKTVALKTIGLLSFMTMCGLMIPAKEESEISVFNKIFADIGDEQSIEQSLSTFSSHMVNIISVLSECDDNSLVLFDELCAGTDPIEGAALAKSILMKLHSIGAKTVATTHYPELKAYAIDTPGVENASCEFDISTLKPTYKIIIGVPGRSNAFAISKKLGLPDEIISAASEQVTDNDLRFERVVAALENARQSAQEEHIKAEKIRLELEDAKSKNDELQKEFSRQREKLLNSTRDQSQNIIERIRYEAGLLLNQLEEMKRTINAENAASTVRQAKAYFNKALTEMQDTANPVEENIISGQKLKNLPLAGDKVTIESIGSEGTVISTDESKNSVYVAVGQMKLWVKLSDLLFKNNTSEKKMKKPQKITGIPSRGERNISGEIDLRGMAADEALIELDKYIDNAVLSGIGTICIIHGKGTGVLRKAVQAHLKSHKNIKTYRIGLFGEGENGVTIAEIKN